MSLSDQPPHLRPNREIWDSRHSRWFGGRARRQWTADPHWGIWAIPQTDLPVFPDELGGKDLLDLGCGTAYIGAWAAARGARPVGIDVSAAQLRTARALQIERGTEFPVILGDAERVPCRDGSFDVVISEHGASAWCDPYRWIPEAARLLRPGGELVFLRSSTLLTLCAPSGDGPAGMTLTTAQFGLNRVGPPDGPATFALPTGEMIRLLRISGLIVDDLIEVQAPVDATTDFDYVTPQWGRRWPSEEVWKAHRPASSDRFDR